ncbi:MAG: hypothetical protein JJE44_00535 [Flavobacteriaceae bacterium]|nr:hypothetical protein [Flavobacteriaceae bacterium]
MKKIILAFICLILYSNKSEAQEVVAKSKNSSLSWETADGAFSWKLSGRFYFDAAKYFDDKTDLGNGTELRDFRLGVEVKFEKNWLAKIDAGLAGGVTAAKDIFLQYGIDKVSYVRAGHFAEPFGLDYMESSKATKFLAPNSATEAFAPGRKIGLEYVKWGNKYWLAGGLFGDGDLNNTSAGDEGYSVTGRFVFKPIIKEGSIVHLGLAGTYRTADAVGFDADGNELTKNIRYRSRAETHVEGRRFIDAKITNAVAETKYAVEFIGALKPVALQAEYFGASVNREDSFKTYTSNGWYAQASWQITGKNYKYSNSWSRLSDPDPKTLELVVRYNQVDLNDSGADIFGGLQKDISVGLNYHVNKSVKLRLNYSNIDLDEYALNGKENFGLIQTRLQFAF